MNIPFAPAMNFAPKPKVFPLAAAVFAPAAIPFFAPDNMALPAKLRAVDATAEMIAICNCFLRAFLSLAI